MKVCGARLRLSTEEKEAKTAKKEKRRPPVQTHETDPEDRLAREERKAASKRSEEVGRENFLWEKKVFDGKKGLVY